MPVRKCSRNDNYMYKTKIKKSMWLASLKGLSGAKYETISKSILKNYSNRNLWNKINFSEANLIFNQVRHGQETESFSLKQKPNYLTRDRIIEIEKHDLAASLGINDLAKIISRFLEMGGSLRNRLCLRSLKYVFINKLLKERK